MGKNKSLLEDWLDECGHDLGYDIGFYPEISQLNVIKTKRIYRRQYGQWKSQSNNKKMQ